jgi:autotransporter translocation and assembly factor TamB
VAEEGQTNLARGSWRRRALIALAIFGGLLLIFHRPVLLSLGRVVALHYAAKENLKIDFQIEGSVFTNLTVRNLHIVATGVSDIESIDADFARVNYGFFTLLRRGIFEGLENLEVHSARIVINPKKGKPHDPKKKDTVFDFFPGRAHLTDVTFIIRDTPHDLVVEHADLDLDPRKVGALKAEKLQLMQGQNWSKVSAQTSYTNKNLVLHEIALGADRIHSFGLDASHLDKRTLTLNLDADIGGGKISGSLQLTEQKASLLLLRRTIVHAKNVSADALNKYAGLPEGFLGGQIERLDVDLTGEVDRPVPWLGNASMQLANFRAQEITFGRCTLEAWAKDGKAELKSADIVQGENHFHLHGSARLPSNMRDFRHIIGTLEATGSAPDLRKATAQKVSGSAQLTGKIDINNEKLSGEFTVAAASLGFQDGAIEKLNVTTKITKILDFNKPWFADLKSETSASMSHLKFRKYTADSMEVNVHSAGDLVTCERATVKRKANEFVASGEYRLPKDIHDADKQPGKIDISLNAPQLGDYWVADSPDKITGPLQMNGQLRWKDGAADGQLSLSGVDVRMRDLVFHQVSGQCTVAKSVIYLNDFRAALNDRDFVTAHAMVDLRAPFKYSGKIAANVADLSTLKPLLHGEKKELAGSLVLNWEGSGERKTLKNSGKLKFALEKGRYANMKSLQANVDATYSPEGLEVPIIYFGSDKMIFQAIAQAKGEALEITQIQLDQGRAKYASGYVSVPFVWKNLGTSTPVSPGDGKVAITFQSENLDLKKLFDDLGTKPPATGFVNVKLNAQGTLAKLDARLDVQMRNLRNPEIPKLEPASFDLTATVQNNQLNIAGKLQQAKIQPLELTANIPFDAVKIARAGNLSDDTPIKAKVRLPRSSVNFIRQFVPDVQQIDGDLALDVDVSGTIGHPALSGAGDITINVARANNTTFPALTNFKARLIFHDDTLKLEQFGGDLSGGKFTLAGGMTFPKLTQPQIDVQFKAESALVARNDIVTVRLNADVKITGPLNAASVTGTIATTDSHVLKNIDLLPIGLPGRPPPQPPASRDELSFPVVRDWKFDVAITTKDAFRIRGNLADGGAIADLHLTGTGLHPGLDGTVRLEKVEATLPFSRLEVGHGFLYFNPSDSLNPKLDLHGTSVIRDYTIHVYIYGTSVAPEAVFTSEPPLPQEEVISLLATGTTREELTGNNNVLASRAATLLVQQLYRKIFKKTGETQSSSVFDRLDLDVGQTDPRTGQREATARFKVNDQFVLMGDLDVTGSFKGMVKYLIRFH